MDPNLLRPHWNHKSCGGTVVITETGFQCRQCQRAGAALGAVIPERTLNHAEYFKTHPELEVALLSAEEAAAHPVAPISATADKDRPFRFLRNLAGKTGA
jgi:hypothetical protein